MVKAAWLTTLRQTVERTVGRDVTLVVAVSGGGDSVALLRGLAHGQKRLGVRLIVAHLDHALRPESGADAALVGRLAAELGLFCVRERVEVAALAEREKLNLEAAARQVRYRMLEQVGQAVGAAAIVVAHTLDDQAETVLMHLLRGAGPEGLSGMKVLGPPPFPLHTTPILRPLLGIERATLRDWLTVNNYTWCEDSTNEDTSRLRSRVRHVLLPFLEQEAPHLKRQLGRTAAAVAADIGWMEAAAARVWNELTTQTDTEIRWGRAAFRAQPYALQRRLVRRAFYELAPDKELRFSQIEQMVAVATGAVTGKMVTLPGGVTVRVEREAIVMGRKPHPPAPSPFGAGEQGRL